MIIVCDEETCAWRNRAWLFMVLWLFTAFILGVALVNARHERQECMETFRGVVDSIPAPSTENLPLDTERKAN